MHILCAFVHMYSSVCVCVCVCVYTLVNVKFFLLEVVKKKKMKATGLSHRHSGYLDP